MQWIAIGIGAALGACLRAWLARFNSSLSHLSQWSWLPAGTLMANILGGLLIGMALVVFEKIPIEHTYHGHLKMFIITGFLGGLTTWLDSLYLLVMFLTRPRPVSRTARSLL